MPKTRHIKIAGQQWELAFRSLKRRQLCEYDRRRVSVADQTLAVCETQPSGDASQRGLQVL